MKKEHVERAEMLVKYTLKKNFRALSARDCKGRRGKEITLGLNYSERNYGCQLLNC